MRIFYRDLVESRFDRNAARKLDREVKRLANEHRYIRALVMVPGASALIFGPLSTRIGNQVLSVAVVLTVTAACLGLTILLLRHQYRRFAYRAIVNLGLADICAWCGYDRGGHDDDAACPECGRRPAAAEEGNVA